MSKITPFRNPEPQENDQKTGVQKALKNSVTKPYFSDFEMKLSENRGAILPAEGYEHPSLFQPFSTLTPRGVIFDPRAPRDLKMTPKLPDKVSQNHRNSTKMLKGWTPTRKQQKQKKKVFRFVFRGFS